MAHDSDRLNCSRKSSRSIIDFINVKKNGTYYNKTRARPKR